MNQTQADAAEGVLGQAVNGKASTEATPDPWTVRDAVSLYMIDRWGTGYFDVNAKGNITVAPLRSKGARIDLMDVVQKALGEGQRLPLLVRFQDVLHDRVKVLNTAFDRAIREANYRGQYRGVFPIKVNQLREVVEEILVAGRPYHYGIEVGSKPEMFAALSVHTDNESLVVCNGYKDDQFIRMALTGRRLGKKVILIAEKLGEVRAIARVAKEMNVEPMIGVRVRLQAKGAGKWATSGGENAKFGLSTSEILEAVKILKAAGMDQALKLVHFHVGSQVPDILIVKRAVREAARYYAKLRQMGQQVEYFDVGGGLAIDYDGSRSTCHSSMNYSIDEYAADIVYNVADVCDEERVPHPNLVSESGRAIVAHHSVLVVEAFGAVEKTPVAASATEPKAPEHKLLKDLSYVASHLTDRNLAESWHDLLHAKEQAQSMFELGLLPLDVKGCVEETFWDIAERIAQLASRMDPAEVPEDLGDMTKQLADQQICNFSVFQSLLDHWAFGALFPIVPLHRLNEEPKQPSTLVDITCDSDGKVERFIDLPSDYKETLLLHHQNEEPYLLGVFLTGAYQDIMGDLHNLFGRVNEVHVFLDEDEDEGYYLEELLAGHTIAEVLQMTQYFPQDLVQKFKNQVDNAIKQDRLKPSEGMRMLQDYERGLKDQTYLTLKGGR